MEIIKDLDRLSLINTSVCLGNFDGFHLGHRRVVSLMKSRAEDLGLKSVIFTFEPHPYNFFGKDIKLISTKAQRMEIFSAQDTDYLITAPFNEALAGLSPRDFFKNILVDKLGAKVVVVGSSYRFGSGRSGDIGLLEKLGEEYGVKCIFAENVKDSHGQDISSSRIRSLISEGSTDKAAECLGRHYYIDGKVVHGGGRGKGFGFPTANLESENMIIPLSGVYASSVTMGSDTYKAMTYIGVCPSVEDNGKLRIETNIFNLNKDIYDTFLRVSFKERIRGEIKFNTIDELKSQMMKDKARAESCE
ncbi:MAG: bifunctional riboflavin kinase/FAD synthetase [Deferribacterales bacterium]|nr:bifunctional riboflavin kinase/FAD synthetase [Deferribacterales bacterium]